MSQTLPELFIKQLHELGLETLADTMAEGRPETSVRLNPMKLCKPDGLPFDTDGQPGWCGEGFYLPERPLFTADPLFHQGCYYVQEASSMFHAFIIRQLTGRSGKAVRLLDACAAPGGKTTAAISALPEGSLAVANEYVPARAAVLRENIIKWGYPNCIVTRGDTSSFAKPGENFDIVMADVPCSGEGMMRKEPEAVAQWSPKLVADCAARQWEIVSNLWPALKPGGYFIYSTCTFNRSENEEIVERMIAEFDAESVDICPDPSWGIASGIDTEATCYRFIPGQVRGEGLFTAVLRKSGGAEETGGNEGRKRQSGHKGKLSATETEAARFVKETYRDKFDIYTDGERITAFPSAHSDMLRQLKKATDIIYEGVTLCTVKGRDLIPAHALAMSPLSARDAFPGYELKSSEALDYLSGEAITLPESTPRGFVLLTYMGNALGFAKNIGRRANNLYPTAWRIRVNFKNIP